MNQLRHEECLRYFSEVLKILSSTNQHEEVFHYVVDRVVRIFKCQTCAIVVVDPNTEYLHIENAFGLSHTFTKEFRRKLATGTIGRLLWSGTPIVVPDSSADPKIAGEVQLEHPFGSCLCVPIDIDHRTLGYLYMDHRQAGTIDAKDVGMATCFALLAGLALNKSRMFEENLHLDTIDHETDTEKYGHFLERLGTHVERAQKFGEKFALLLLDVDNYKQIALTYGYDTSRILLKDLARLVKSHLRSMDGAGRFGFDEIILLRANSSLDEAVSRADELRTLIEHTAFTPRQIRTSVSIGVAAFPENAGTIGELLATLKNALFEAQRNGRNCVFHYHARTRHENTPVG